MNAQYSCAMLSAILLLNLREDLMIRLSRRCHQGRAEARHTVAKETFRNLRNARINSVHVI